MNHTVIIPAAGAGARFYELGKQYPKCLLPYQGKPIVAHLVNMIRKKIGSCQIRIVVKSEDKDHELWKPLGSDVSFYPVITQYSQGPATSLYSALADVEDQTKVTVVLSDMVLQSDFPLSSCVTLDNALFLYDQVDDQSRWCMTDGKQFYDKPRKPVDGHALLGCYTFSDGMFVRELLREQVETEQNEPQFSTMIAKYAQRYQFNKVIVDKSMVVDLGTLEEFLQNRTGVRPRHFNVIEYGRTTVTKKSTSDKEKIRNEAMWLSYPPVAYKNAVPCVSGIDPSVAEYTMERMYGHNLRDLALYYDKSYRTWADIFTECWRILENERTETSGGNYWPEFIARVRQRTDGRLAPLYDILTEILAPYGGRTAYHGDLHFSNMFWCTPGQYLKVVDPRGEYYGHWLYDVAKLHHSVVGRYDYIDEGMYIIRDGVVTYYEKGQEEIERAFEDKIWDNLTPGQQTAVTMISSCLFASMIPLHDNEEHQMLFRSEFERLYKKKPPGGTGW